MGAFLAIHASTVWTVIGVVFAAVMGAATITRNRVGAAAASFVSGIGPWWDGFIIFGAIYVVFGFLLVRAGRQMGDVDNRGGARR